MRWEAEVVKVENLGARAGRLRNERKFSAHVPLQYQLTIKDGSWLDAGATEH